MLRLTTKIKGSLNQPSLPNFFRYVKSPESSSDFGFINTEDEKKNLRRRVLQKVKDSMA